jgi:hypothetical protein
MSDSHSIGSNVAIEPAQFVSTKEKGSLYYWSELNDFRDKSCIESHCQAARPR